MRLNFLIPTLGLKGYLAFQYSVGLWTEKFFLSRFRQYKDTSLFGDKKNFLKIFSMLIVIADTYFIINLNAKEPQPHFPHILLRATAPDPLL